MLTRLHLQNFRGFGEHKVPLRRSTVIVGRNNAGKSTIVEALRLVAIVENRYQALSFNDVPDWLDIARRNRGVRPSLAGVDINTETIFHGYGDPPAKITATFDTDQRIEVYIGPKGEIFGVILDESGNPITTRSQAHHVQLPDLAILPQVAPVSKDETVLTADHVRRSLTTNLASSHFRNQLNLLYEYFQRFRELAEASWPGLGIVELQGRGALPTTSLQLMLRDGGFVGELAAMGHGLQMWLQTIWFLARTASNYSIILDEPDVYMHADLQRRLVRMLRHRYRQTIIATHSIEILGEVEPDEVLVIDRRKPESIFATELPAVQKVVDHIGGVHNIQLARLWASRRCLLVEGNDLAILKRLHAILFPESSEPLDAIPHMSLQGWGGWNYAIGSSMLLRNAVDESVIAYCIFDADYHTPDEISARKQDATNRGVSLHIWSRKEIENYLLVPSAIARTIAECNLQAQAPTEGEIVAQLDLIAEELKEDVKESISDAYLTTNKGKGVRWSNHLARERIAAAWGTHEGRMSIVPGKTVLSRVAAWAQQTYGTSFSPQRLAQTLLANEITSEVASVLTAIERACPYP